MVSEIMTLKIEKAKSNFVLSQVTMMLAGFYFLSTNITRVFGLIWDRIIALVFIILSLSFGVRGVSKLNSIKN